MEPSMYHPHGQVTTIPLSSPPQGFTIWKASTPWKTVRSMLGLVLVCFFISNIAVVIAAGVIDSNFDGNIGPFDPILSFIGSICLLPFIGLFLYLRREQLTHAIYATPSHYGTYTHMLEQSVVVQSPVPTTVNQHLVRSNAPLEMPSSRILWLLFFLGITISTVTMYSLVSLGINEFTVLLVILIAVPAWFIGFSTPVFAWWSITSKHFGLVISRRDAEMMLVAGMLSTVPAIIINSLLSPVVITSFGFDPYAARTLGEGFLLFLSAPIGEELSKALAVIALSRFIASPKHGFYVGSTVGLGFALLENALYVSMALASDPTSLQFFFTSIIRGISSIPGHALWTGITGYGIGWYYSRSGRSVRQNISLFKEHTEQAEWATYGKDGMILQRSGWATMPSTRFVQLIQKHAPRAWRLPQTITAAVYMAMFGHGMWNGSTWVLSVWLGDDESMTSVFIQLSWLIVMILVLWLCILRILPTVMYHSNTILRENEHVQDSKSLPSSD